ncbi:MFS transporter [Cupriavidus sp. TKC]|uniref:MFS transporter n=1 Tax=Cupriavidus sp. TKC TaxID=2880159 RepID=UPI0025A85470|nr:MFS transporter [Cupriavidus sp. TKC]GMG90497.1 MFS transporter [Cupriavidus sp. TKC]
MSQPTTLAGIQPAGASAPGRLNADHYRVLGLSTLGGALEFYEFVIFIFLAPILSAVMFPAEVPAWLRQLQTLGIFAAGYLVRPLGGLVLSMLGDKLGRKRMFGVTLILMAAPTLCIGLLPTYAQAGAVAPLLLLLCRLCQGMAMGGEFPTAVTFIAEHVPERRLGFSIGTLGAAFTLGTILGIFALMATGAMFDKSQMTSIGWRVPFIAGGVFGLLSSWLRRHVKETPVFEEMRRRKDASEVMPLRTLFRRQPREVLICLAASATTAGVLSAALLFPVTYLQVELGFPRDVVHHAQLWMTLSLLVGTLAGGALLDRFGWVPVITLFGLATAAGIGGTFAAPDPHSLRYGWALVGFGAGFTTMMHNILVRSFTPEVRVTGIALTYNLSQAVVGGLLPVLMGSVVHFWPMGLVWIPVGFIALAILVTPLSLRYRKPMHVAHAA